MVNLFYEPSTRTQYSFDIAASKLGIKVINPSMERLSDNKGENLTDTVSTFQQMGASLITIRHPFEKTPHKLSNHLNIPILNAGDGQNQHPSQAFIDTFTILQKKQNINDLSIAIVGDSLHSRVAHSLCDILSKLQVKDIRLTGPESLIYHQNTAHISHHTNLLTGIKDADVIIALRIQKERFTDSPIPNDAGYHEHFGLTTEKLAHAKPDAIIMHPGPVNRGIEITNELIDSTFSVIHQQIHNSIPVRMALIDYCLNT